MQQLLEPKKKDYHFLKVEPAQPSILEGQGFIFQRKFDGVSSEIKIDNEIEIIGRGVMKGRNSIYTENFPELMQDLRNLNLPEGTDFLSEIIVIDQTTGIEDFSLVQTRTGRQTNIEMYATLYPALMIVHDVVRIGEHDVTGLSYLERMEIFKRYYLFGKSKRVFPIGFSQDGRAEWEDVERMKLEGLVIRDPKSTFGHGVWKLKREFTEDVFCIGEHEASKSDTNSNLEYTVRGEKRKGVFANLKCYQLKNGTPVSVCDIGGGFSQSDRIIIQEMLDLGLITREKPLVLEVKANARLESGKLRHPAFVRIRADKPHDQCVMCA